MTWNTRRASLKRLRRGVRVLQKTCNGPIALQECHNVASLRIRGFCTYSDVFAKASILWPSRLGEVLGEHITDEGISGVVLKNCNVFFASLYLPDSWKPLGAWNHAVERLGGGAASCYV